MVGVMKKIMPISKSMSGNDFLYDFDNDISVAFEYKGSPVNHNILPKVLPVDIDHIPTAKAVVSLNFLNNLSLPVVQPVVFNNHRTSKDVNLGSWTAFSKNCVEHSFSDASDHAGSDGFDEIVSVKGFSEIRNLDNLNENGNCKGIVGKNDNGGFDEIGSVKGFDEIGSVKGFDEVESLKGFNEIDCVKGVDEIECVKGFSEIRNLDYLNENGNCKGIVGKNDNGGFDEIESVKGVDEIGCVKGFDEIGCVKGFDEIGSVKGFDEVESLKGFNEIDCVKGVDEIECVKGFDRFGNLQTLGGKNDDGEFSGKLDDEEVLPNCGYGIESSGSIVFSNSTRDHSHEFSYSSDTLETPIDCNEIEEEEESDNEHLECRRKQKTKAIVTFCDQKDSVYNFRQRPVPQRPAKRGMCYNCHNGNRFTEKEACLVCDAKFCGNCILRVMGSMPEGRKCLTCIGCPIDDSKRHMLGRCSRVLKGLLKEEEVNQIMNHEVYCDANQLPAQCIFVNGSPLCMEELMELRRCSNPPSNLKPGNYWYDRVSGFWGKGGQKPCQIITPELNVGDSKMKRDASNGNTNVLINGREITKAELWMLKSAGVQCDGNVSFWLDEDGTYQEEGMNRVKGKLWGRKRTKVLCSLLSLPTLESPNPGSRSKHANGGGFSSYLEHRALCKVLLVGNDRSGTSTIYKQARVLYKVPFSEEERQYIKSMIQSNMYGYLGRLLELREQLEEESLSIKRKGKSIDQDGPSDSKTDYSLGPKLKAFSEWLISVIVSGNLDIIFPAATRENAVYVEDLWKNASIQATYSRRDDLGLPRPAIYFLDRAVEIAKVDYEPTYTDILYAEGINSSNGLKSMEFLFPQSTNDAYKDPTDQPDPVTRWQLIRVHEKSLGKKCKYLDMFEDASIVLFCVSLTEYGEYESDINGKLQNRMLQSKKLFESIITHPRFKETNFLLILNKFDLMVEMLAKASLTQCEWFDDFNPIYSRHLAQLAFHYIAGKFKRLFKSVTGRKLYVSRVIGLESDMVDGALRYAREIVKWEDDKLSFSLNESSSESIEGNTNTSYR